MQDKFIKTVIAATASMFAVAPAQAEQGDLLVRLRAIMVAPQETHSHVMPLGDGSRVKVSNDVVPELDFTYMWTNNIGTELILATSKHNISGFGAETTTARRLGKLASTYALPPTLILQYHFNPDGAFRPYVGAGVNYTIFYSRKPSKALEAAVGDTDVKLKNSFGYALQGGFDIPVGKRSFVNVDVKFIDMDSKARLTTAGAGVLRVNSHIDPVVVGIGYGLRF
ncbi:OmpW/AlkL family protein [Sphingomonas quercus]|uniref:OmpW family protein n=1 Tax=Sphingomonas quercus TaxID=2842451 RepID=A0ABS6BM24_9SPHN|nr:OmpW family protein [Sphingomonas quercus]MBU3079367.1 OmpW family protein [Sphingomonas quercus]